MTENEELEKLVAEAKQRAERPPRESINALLQEAAERRAKADQEKRKIAALEQTERRLIIAGVIIGLFW